VRGKDFQATAPADSRESDLIEFARIRMQRELVQDTIAALAGLRVRVAAHGMSAQAVCETERVRGVTIAVDHGLPKIGGCYIKNVCEALGVLQEQLRLHFVAACNPGVQSRSFAQLLATTR